MRNILERLLDDLGAITRNIAPLSKKLSYLFLYLYLRAKEAFLARVLRSKTDHQNIFGHTIFYSDFSLFINMFVGVFIEKQYDFQPDSPRPRIVDCGANIGIASLYFLLKYPQASILCFEPSSSSFRLLRKNLSSFANVKLVNAALVGSNKRFVILKSPQNACGTHTDASIFGSRWDSANIKEEKVKAVKLSNFIEEGEVIDFLKIDIEGAEEGVLKDLETTSKLKNIKEICVEYHNYKNNSLEAIIKILKRNGFELLFSGGVRPPLWKYKDKFYTLLIYAYRYCKLSSEGIDVTIR